MQTGREDSESDKPYSWRPRREPSAVTSSITQLESTFSRELMKLIPKIVDAMLTMLTSILGV